MKRIRYIPYTKNMIANLVMVVATHKLFRAKNIDTMENIVLVSLDKYKILGPSSNNKSNRVGFSQEMKDAILNNKNTEFAILHNHPNNGGLSIMDLAAFIRHPNLKILVAVTNNLEHFYVLYKRNTTSEIEESAWQYFDNLARAGYGHRSANSYRELLESNGFIMEVY